MTRAAIATLVPLPAADQDYRTLVAVLRAMAEAVEPQGVLRALAEGLHDLAGATWLGVVRRSENGALIAQITVEGRVRGRWETLDVPEPEGPAASWLLPETPRSAAAARASIATGALVPRGVSHVLSVPLPEGGGGTRNASRRRLRPGALLLGRTDGGAFPAGLIPLVEALATQCAALLERFDWLARARGAEGQAPRGRPPHDAAPAPQSEGRWLSFDSRGRDTIDLVERAAETDLPILLIGESGTGKELLAHLAHSLSSRAAGPFIAINVATLQGELAASELFGHVPGAFTGAAQARRGLVEEAHGGTLFLDEIGDMPAAVQPALLRFLEDGAVRPVGANRVVKADVRIVAATNRDLAADTISGRFREDLFHRLAGVEVRLPPLRERPTDLRELARHFLEASSDGRYRELPAHWLPAFRAWHWPGNVRELRNAIRAVAALSRGPLPEDRFLPPAIRTLLDPSSAPRRQATEFDGCTLAEAEKLLIQRALDACGNNRAQAALRLGVPTRTFFEKLKRIDAEP